MGQNIVELGFNVEQLTAEKKQVLDLFVDLFGKLQEYDGTRFNPLGNGGLSDLKKSLQDGAAAMSAFGQSAQKYNDVITQQYDKQRAAKKSTDELTLSTNEYKKIQDGIATTQAKANAAGSNAAENLAIEKEQLKQRNAELQAGVKYLLSETGSVLEAKAAIAQLTIERNKQNASTDEGKAKIAELNAAIDKNNRFINENTSAIEQQKNNVGNYIGAINVLGPGLARVNAQLEQMAASGDQTGEAYQRLVLEQKILAQALTRQQEGFATVNAEMRATKATLDALDLAGAKNSETFEQLNTVYTTAGQKVKDLHREQAILTTDAPALTALTGVARGLGGAYAFGAGASALFSDGNEKIEKELNKLVAIMTFLQGLTEAVSVLKERNAIVTALEAEATKALNLVKRIEASIFGESKAAVEADTIAKQINTDVQAANTEALEANAAGAVITAGAVGGVVVAEEAATAATITFRTALISTGIGAIIIGLIYGITKLVGAISDWANADEKAIEKQKALAEVSKAVFDTQKKLNDLYEDDAKHRLDSLEKVDAGIKAAGKNEFIQLDNERRIAEQRKQIAEDELRRYGITQDNKAEKFQHFKDAVIANQQTLDKANKSLAEATAKDPDSKETKKLKEIVEAGKAQIDFVQSKYDAVTALDKDYEDNSAKINENTIKTAKAGYNELEKLTADAAQRRYDIEKDAADRILNEPTASFSEKENAVKAGYRADEALANAHISAIQEQVKRQMVTEAAGADEIAKIQTELNLKYNKAVDDRVKLKMEERDRNITAQNAVSKNNNEGDAAIQEAITKDTQKELDARLGALQKNIDDKTAIIVDDYNTQIKLAKDNFKTDDEIRQLTSERDKQLVALTADTQKQIYDIVTSYGEKRLRAIEDQNKTGIAGNSATVGFNQETDALNTALINRTISYSKYVTSKKLLDQKYAIEKAEGDIKDDEASLQRIRDFELKENGIKLEFARIALDLAKQGGNEKEIADAQSKFDALKGLQVKANADEIALTKKLNDDHLALNRARVKSTEEIDALLAEKGKQIAVGSYNLAKTLVDASYENRINAIQKTIDKQDEQYNNEIAAVQRSTLSQQQQAAEVIILTAQKNAQDTSLKNQQKKEKIAEAKFDRDVSLAEVAWNTAKAIMKDTAGVPFPLSLAIAAADGALGAIQAATILAKPIPTYGDGIGIPGKGRHAGGEAIVGERWKPEKISIPGYEPFILDKPTLLNLPPDSSVLPMSPSEMIWEIGAAGMARTAAQFSQPRQASNEAWDIARWQMSQTKRMYQKSQRNIINKITVNVDADWNNYVNTKVLGKR